MPFGKAAKALLVGAKTVNGPLPERVSASPAACTAFTRVEKEELPAAISTIVLVGAGRFAMVVTAVFSPVLARSLASAAVPTIAESKTTMPRVRTVVDRKVSFMAVKISKRVSKLKADIVGHKCLDLIGNKASV